MTEKAEVKRDGATAQKNSGRGQYQKGDARLGPFTIDYKEYPKGIRVDINVWTKICTDAFKNGNTEPLLKIVLGAGSSRTRLVVMSEEMFNALRDRGWDESTI